MNSSSDVQTVSTVKPSFWERFLRIGIPVLFLLLCGGIFIVYFLGVFQLRQATERFSVEKRQLVEKASLSCIDIQRQDISLFALPLAWSVRKEVIQGNYAQIDEYFSELVKVRGFGIILLVEPEGNIRVSTDRRLLGSSFSSLYPGLSLDVQQPVTYPFRDGKSLFVLPVMGLNGRIGTIAFDYSYKRMPQP